MPRVTSESANAHTAFLAVCMRRFDRINEEAKTGGPRSSSSSTTSSQKNKQRSKPYEKTKSGRKHDKRDHTPGPSEVPSLDTHDGSSCGSPSSPRTPADLQAILPVNGKDDDDFTIPTLPMNFDCPFPEGLQFSEGSVGLLGLRALGLVPPLLEEFGPSALGVQLLERTASDVTVDDMFERYINKDVFAEDCSA